MRAIARPSMGSGEGYTVVPRRWPQQGQGALVLGKGRPAASPHEQPVPIASLAKVMTAYLTLERYPLSGAQDGFTIIVTADQAQAAAQAAAEDESFVAVRAGEQLSERQLLEALLIPSGNNVARMLAAMLAGSETRFLAEMNAEARALGMDHTIYTDPSGFDPSTVSTAADQLRVFQRATRFQVFRQIVSMAGVTLPVAGTVTNFNPLTAESYAGKTGSDSAAGGCLAFFTDVTVGGRRLTAVGVVMGQGRAATRRRSSPPRARPPSSWSTPSPRRSACARQLRLARLIAEDETPAAMMATCGCSSPVAREVTICGPNPNEQARIAPASLSVFGGFRGDSPVCPDLERIGRQDQTSCRANGYGLSHDACSRFAPETSIGVGPVCASQAAKRRALAPASEGWP
jgi:serine-type D-Ala-D-Ala carboxypeptidase (penicillin-binding protein 5/6)